MVFKSRDDIEEYCQNVQIECLECGRLFSFLPPHLRRAHDMTADEYREAHNIPASAPLAGTAYREAHRAKIQRQVASGALDYQHLARATEEARTAGRGQLRDYDREARANRTASIQHDQLPPGANRADGRDADRARAYQRKYRQKKLQKSGAIKQMSDIRERFEEEIKRSPYANIADRSALLERSADGGYALPLIQAAWWGYQKTSRENRRPWSADDDAYLIANADTLTYKKIGENLGRSTGSVRLRAQILGVKQNTSHRENDEKILANRSKPDIEIAKMLGVSPKYVAQRRYQLGISNKSIPRFTDDELVIVRDMSKSNDEVAAELGRKPSSIKNKRRAIGLK